MPRLLPLATAALAALALAAPAADAARPKAHISLVDATTGEASVLRAAPGRGTFYASAVWSADGKTIYVVRESHSFTGGQVLALDPETGRAKTLVNLPLSEHIEISPAADRIAYWTIEKKVAYLKVQPITGGTPVTRALVERTGDNDRFVVSDMSWSPDGTRLAMGTNLSEAGYEGATSIVDSTTLAPLVSGETLYPVFDDNAWSPDGSTLYFREFSYDRRSLSSMSAADGSQEIIDTAKGQGDLDAHAVAADGTFALAARRAVSVNVDERILRAPRRTHMAAVEFSPNGGTLAYAYTQDGRKVGRATLEARSVRSGRRKLSADLGLGEPVALAYAPDAKRLVALVALEQVDR